MLTIERKEVKPSLKWPNYGATACGLIYRLSSGKQMKMYPMGRSGYLAFRACHDNKPSSVFVHVCVGDAWLSNDDPENKTQTNHKDGNKLNNNVSNLENVTPSQNQRHAVSTGLKGRGEDLYNSSLTNDAVHLVCQDLMDGLLVKDIAEKYGSTKDIIRKIRSGDTYFHIRVLYPIKWDYRKSYSESTVRWVCEQIVSGVSDAQIAIRSTNKQLTTIEVKRIRFKIRYKAISDDYF